MADPYQDHPSNSPGVDSVWSSVGGSTMWIPGSVNGGSMPAAVNSAVVLGDSVSAYDGVETGTVAAPYGDGWFSQLCARSGQRIEQYQPDANDSHNGNFAYPGYTSAQVAASGLPLVLALNPKPAYAFLATGVNDNKTTGLATSKAAYLAMAEALADARILPILCTIMPGTTTPRKWNLWVLEVARAHGWPVFDMHQVMAAATGGQIAAWTHDGPHPNSLGYKQLALAGIGSGGLLDLFAPARRLTTIAADDELTLISAAGIFGTDSNTNGVDDRWITTFGGTITANSLDAASGSEVLAGDWQHMNRTAADSGSGAAYYHLASPPTTGWSNGDVIEFSGKVKSSGFDALWSGAPTGANAKSFTARVAQRIGATDYYVVGVTTWRIDTDMATFRHRWTIGDGTAGSPAGPAGVPSKLDIQLLCDDPGSNTLDVYWGEVSLRNLTTGSVLLGT